MPTHGIVCLVVVHLKPLTWIIIAVGLAEQV